MANERQSKTTVKRGTEPKRARDCRSSKITSLPHQKKINTPDPGPMNRKK